MERVVRKTKQEMGAEAARHAAQGIRQALAAQGEANIILATGASQFEMLEHLVRSPDVDWSKVTMFHLDEYVGMDKDHPASFVRYLQERFVDQVPGLKGVDFVNGEAEPRAECRRLGELISAVMIDVACIGIGENGHLAFNDPPADFDTEIPYLVVELDEACRRQQLGEGWFEIFEDVPSQAISMSIRHIMKSKTLVVTVPDDRKAEAVRNAVEGPITNKVPASILRFHPDCTLYLDEPAASLLTEHV